MRESNYAEELRKVVKCVNEQEKSFVNDCFQEFLMEITDSYLQAYHNKDFDMMNQMLCEQRKLRRELTTELRKCSVQSIISASKVVQTYNIFNKIAQGENEKKNFGKEMDIIMKSHGHAKEVLVYLYKHEYVQHKVLKGEFNIPASTLTDLLKAMTDIECVECMRNGKYSFYNLTNEGRKYAKDTIKDIDDEVIVDADSFREGSRNTVKKKCDYGHRIDKSVNMKPYYISGNRYGMAAKCEMGFKMEKMGTII